jgi:putative exosortase-associated protein (TIGR04073 family)
MRIAMSILTCAALAAVFTSGCSGPEDKLGRGLSNIYEPARMGEMQRSIEQTAIFDPDAGFATGLVRGINNTLKRTVMGACEIVTFPIPPYRPVFTNTVKPYLVYPDSYKPGLISSGVFDTDQYMGFSGGDVAPFIPGSRFTVFEN